jgi:methionyl-tRNA formyltransferase
MRLLILTQDDPFYLARNISYLLDHLPPYAEVVGTVVFDVSPFGKRESFSDKLKKTYKIFGLSFFVRYGIKYVFSKLNPANNVRIMLAGRNIPLIEIEGNINKDENLDKLRAFKPDLLVSIAGNQIFKKKMLETVAPKGCINLHTALLPKYRGLMPSFWVLKNGESETGVSVFFVDEGIDSGPILVQNRIPITPTMTQAALIEISKKAGMDAIVESVEKIYTGQYELQANDASQMTYFTFPTADDVRLFRKAGKRFY